MGKKSKRWAYQNLTWWCIKNVFSRIKKTTWICSASYLCPLRSPTLHQTITTHRWETRWHWPSPTCWWPRTYSFRSDPRSCCLPWGLIWSWGSWSRCLGRCWSWNTQHRWQVGQPRVDLEDIPIAYCNSLSIALALPFYQYSMGGGEKWPLWSNSWPPLDTLFVVLLL